MKKLIYIILCLLIVGNCNIKSIEEYHGVSNLESKQKKLIISKSNKNDIIGILLAKYLKPRRITNYQSHQLIIIKYILLFD